MAAPTLPKKGILKNNQQQRESGYYSSPERSESSELLGGAAMSLLASSPPKRAMGRKGILKRNGKYSTFSGPPSAAAVAAAAAAALCEAGTAAESGLSRSQSRPSSIVGEDGSARVVDLSTNQVAGVLHHDDAVQSVTFDPTGAYLLSGASDGKIYVWS
jgi:NUAK family SNF1-like kinase